MKAKAVLETAIYAADLAAAERFYAQILGLPVITRLEGRHVFFSCGQGVLLVFNPEATRKVSPNPDLPVPPHGAFGDGHVCFRAEAAELDAWCDHFRSRDIAIEADFRWPNGARSVYVRDPCGNSVEFAEPKIWGLE